MAEQRSHTVSISLDFQQRQRAEALVQECLDNEDATRRLAYELIERRDVLAEMLASAPPWNAGLCDRIEALTDSEVAP